MCWELSLSHGPIDPNWDLNDFHVWLHMPVILLFAVPDTRVQTGLVTLSLHWTAVALWGVMESQQASVWYILLSISTVRNHSIDFTINVYKILSNWANEIKTEKGK